MFDSYDCTIETPKRNRLQNNIRMSIKGNEIDKEVNTGAQRNRSRSIPFGIKRLNKGAIVKQFPNLFIDSNHFSTQLMTYAKIIGKKVIINEIIDGAASHIDMIFGDILVRGSGIGKKTVS